MKIKKLSISILSIIILLSCNQNVSNKTELANSTDSLSYAIGVDLANIINMKSLHEINYHTFSTGLRSSFNNDSLKINEDSLKLYRNNYFKKLQEERSTINLKESKMFMGKNKNKKNILTTESGLQYKIIKEGTGISPKATDMVKCKYHCTLIDGTVYKSSYENGDTIELDLNTLIPGWSEGLQLMKEGGKSKFYIPSELAFGQRVPSGGLIEPNMALIIEVELIEVIMMGKRIKKTNK